MQLLTIQVFVVLLIKPLPRFFKSVIIPWVINLNIILICRLYYIYYCRAIKSSYRNCRLKKEIQNISNNNSLEKDVELELENLRQLIFISAEMKKEDYGTNIRDEYMEKVLIYGYVMVKGN